MKKQVVATLLADLHPDGSFTYRKINPTVEKPTGKKNKTTRYNQETRDWAISRLRSGTPKSEVRREVGCAYATLDYWIGKRRRRSSN